MEKAKADTFIKKFNLENEKMMWPIKSPSGRRLQKAERRSDKWMSHPGKPQPHSQSYKKFGDISRIFLIQVSSETQKGRWPF